jgi:hypothetical protein
MVNYEASVFVNIIKHIPYKFYGCSSQESVFVAEQFAL